MNTASSSHDSLDKIAMTVLKCVSSLELRKKDLDQPKVLMEEFKDFVALISL